MPRVRWAYLLGAGGAAPVSFVVLANLRTFSQLSHHRSLTASVVTLVFAVLAIGTFPLEQHTQNLPQSGSVAVLGLLACAFTLVVLRRDNRTGYPSFRCSIATLLWSLACVPIIWLSMVVVSRVLEMR